jgi:hypothetical protein
MPPTFYDRGHKNNSKIPWYPKLLFQRENAIKISL